MGCVWRWDMLYFATFRLSTIWGRMARVIGVIIWLKFERYLFNARFRGGLGVREFGIITFDNHTWDSSRSHLLLTYLLPLASHFAGSLSCPTRSSVRPLQVRWQLDTVGIILKLLSQAASEKNTPPSLSPPEKNHWANGGDKPRFVKGRRGMIRYSELFHINK